MDLDTINELFAELRDGSARLNRQGVKLTDLAQ
jgi:hypothetical protein